MARLVQFLADVKVQILKHDTPTTLLVIGPVFQVVVHVSSFISFPPGISTLNV